MLVDPITGVLNGCQHRKDTGLTVKKFITIKNPGKYIFFFIKQRESNTNFGLKLSIDPPTYSPKVKP